MKTLYDFDCIKPVNPTTLKVGDVIGIAIFYNPEDADFDDGQRLNVGLVANVETYEDDCSGQLMCMVSYYTLDAARCSITLPTIPPYIKQIGWGERMRSMRVFAINDEQYKDIVRERINVCKRLRDEIRKLTNENHRYTQHLADRITYMKITDED